MSANHSLTILGAPPGRRRDSLALLLRTVPALGEIRRAEDFSDLLDAARKAGPALLVVDAAFDPQRIWLLPALLATVDRPVRLLLIVDNGTVRERARRAGADAVLLRGFTISDLHATIPQLISRK